MEANQRLRETLDRVREELKVARVQAEKSQHEAERYICCSVNQQLKRHLKKQTTHF